MANSAKTLTEAPDRAQIGNIGRLRSRRTTVTFGADYAAAVLPLITANEVGLSEVLAVIPEGAASGTAAGDSVVAAITTGGASFTLKLFNGATAIGTVDESATTIPLLILGY